MKKGFTLLEMMIVISVLSILFLLAVPNIQKVIQAVDSKGCDALVKVVDSAILQYKLSFEHYPDNIQSLIETGLLHENQAQCSNGIKIGIANGQAVLQ